MKNIAVFFLSIWIFFVSSVSAQIPRTISYQGILTDASGNLVPNGTHALTLKLYEQASGGTAIFEESQSVAISHGVFSVILGSVTPILLSVGFDKAYFLGVSVDGGTELVPRTPLMSVPYAIHAEVSDRTNSVSLGTPGVVSSVNDLDGALKILADGATSITTAGKTLTISSTDTSNLRLPYLGTSATAAASLDIRNSSTGSAGKFSITSAANTVEALQVTSSGTGNGISVQLMNTSNGGRGIDVIQTGVGPGVFSTSNGGNALWGITSSISAAGVIGDNTFGEAVVGRTRGGNGVGAVVGRNDSSGYGVRGFNTKAGIGVFGQAGISGGTGVGGRFENVNASNTSDALQAVSNGTGRSGFFLSGATGTVTFATIQAENLRAANEAAWLRNSSATNTSPVIKLNQHPTSTANFVEGLAWDGTNAATRKFHITSGGTFVAGSDFAEAFPVVGNINSYSPGDVLVMNESGSNVEKCSSPNDRRVVGIYSLRPAVLGAEKGGETRLDKNEIPVAITGIVPTKVTTNGGKIKTGDLLTTSSKEGYAMKAKINRGIGTILGKALEPLEKGDGMIRVLVMLR